MTKETSPAVCRYPYCECGPGECQNGLLDARGTFPDEAELLLTKPSNPKDAVGINKAPLSCVPMNVIAEVGIGMMEGALKYGRHNWRGVGVRSSVYFDAAMRHLIAWWEGEDVDPDSGLSHVTKVLTCLSVLRDAQIRGMVTDDRPPCSEPFYRGLNEHAAALVKKHEGKDVKHYTQENHK